MLLQNDRFSCVVVDDKFHVPFASSMMPDGSMEIYRRKEEGLPALDPKADMADFLFHPSTYAIQAVAFTYDRKRWRVIDPSVGDDFEYLATVCRGDVNVMSRSLEDRHWVVAFSRDDSPACYYLYEREGQKATFLFTNRSELEGQPLVPMHSQVINSRDGLELLVYYSLPSGANKAKGTRPDEPLPLVFLPHGGPRNRDFRGLNETHQWLANRGYAELGVNFRSSTGFGKAFTNAGDREWFGKIMEDQEDAVLWAVEEGIADPNHSRSERY